MVLESGMESPESYVSSPEVTNKRPTSLHSRTDQDDKESPTSIRFLGSNAAAGSVIGKGGSTITQFQSQSGTRIQLSRNHEYFPGTTDRIIMITGGINDILTAMDLILSKLQNESHAEDGNDADSASRLRLVVPNNVCGGIIGKRGSTIKSFIENSQAGIKISPQDHGFVGLSDRVVSIAGSLQEKLRALRLIVNKLVEDPHYSQYASSPLSYSGANFSGVHGLPVNYMLPSVVPAGYNMINYCPNGAAGIYPSNKGPMTSVIALSNVSRPTQNSPAAKPMTLGIADERIGLVVGHGGRNITEIMQASGARIKISDRGDFISGTSSRKVMISGTKEAVHVAQTLINQRIASSCER